MSRPGLSKGLLRTLLIIVALFFAAIVLGMAVAPMLVGGS